MQVLSGRIIEKENYKIFSAIDIPFIISLRAKHKLPIQQRRGRAATNPKTCR